MSLTFERLRFSKITWLQIFYAYKSSPTHSLTHTLTQHASWNSMEDWITNFGVQISFVALTSLRRGFAKFHPFHPNPKAGIKNTFSSFSRLHIILR